MPFGGQASILAAALNRAATTDPDTVPSWAVVRLRAGDRTLFHRLRSLKAFDYHDMVLVQDILADLLLAVGERLRPPAEPDWSARDGLDWSVSHAP